MADQSRDPANDDTLTGLFKEVLKKYTQNNNDLLPAQIVSYDRNQQQSHDSAINPTGGRERQCY